MFRLQRQWLPLVGGPMIVLESGSMVSMVSMVGMVTFGVVDSGDLDLGFHADPFVSCEPRLADQFLGPESDFFEVAEPQ